jgi:aminoglycoside/choline kinase family phosphotransferase
MITATKEIESLFKNYSADPITAIERLPQSGGDRVYFRIHTADKSFIATYSDNLKENATFLYFSDHFKKAGAPVPSIFAVNQTGTAYLQEDFGSVSLLNEVESEDFTERVKGLYKKTLQSLAQMQIAGDRGLDYKACITSQTFGRQAIHSDLLYFKYYFLDTLKIPYDKEKTGSDLETLSNYLGDADHKYFMFRDFQSRNVIIKEGRPFFIDYQGGMKGALQYDAASLLWQAKAGLPDEWKNELLSHYISCVEHELQMPVDRERFEHQYNGYVLIRLLQVLGAYGFRGLFERKAHFLTSIPLALQNLKWFLQNKNIGVEIPELERVLNLITADDIIQRFVPIHAPADSPLTVSIKSFSFLKSGYPEAIAGNGGGFVFDCRGILNPGRVEEHKQQTGRDKPVQDYLTGQTRMDEFLTGVFSVVDISVEDYIKRNFESLEVNFGCTGGQHRSVYAADALARHLRNKYGVRTDVKHIEQNFSE